MLCLTPPLTQYIVGWLCCTALCLAFIDTLFDALFALKKRMISITASVTKLTSSAYLDG